MTQLLPLGIYAVQVPAGAKDGFISKDGYLSFYSKANGNAFDTEIKVYGKLILGTVKNSVIDFDCEGIVESKIFSDYGYSTRNYVNYSTNIYFEGDCDSSFLSLLQANNLDLKDSYVILKEK